MPNPILLYVSFLGLWQNTLGICRAILVMFCVAGITLEEKYLSCAGSSNHDDVTVTDSDPALA